MWRVVLTKTATLTELDTTWSFDDLVCANYALTCQQRAMEVT